MARAPIHKNFILLIVAAAQFMVVLDSSIVNVALPSIFRDLHFADTSSLQWVITAYTLAFGGFLLLGGRAADLYGRRKMFLGAVAAFSLCSLICGLAQNSTTLEVARAVQGLSAAFMSPAALSIVLTTFKEGAERAKALSVWGAVAAGGAAAGVLLGGVFTEYLGWEWNFFVNVPVGILLLVMAYKYVPESKGNLDHKQLDLPGAALVTAGLIALVYGVSEAPTQGWTGGRTLLFLGAAVALLVGFIINERRSKHPLMPLSIFRVGNVAAANTTQLFIIAAMFSLFFFLSLYVQQVLGYSPVVSGLTFLPITIVIGLTSTIMPKVIARFGYKKPMVTAPLFMACGLFYLSHIRLGGSYWVDVFPGMVLMAIGMGMMFISVTIAATSGVPARQSGLASGLLNTSQQIGGAIGLAVLTGVSSAASKHYLQTHTADIASAISLTPEAAKQIAAKVAGEAQIYGFHHAFYVAVGLTLFASLIAAVAVRHLPPQQETAEPALHV